LDDPLGWLYLALIIVLIFLAGYFSMAETAFACFNKYRFEVRAEKGSRTASLVLKIANHFDSTLITILIAINAISVALSFLATMLLVKLLPWDETWSSLFASLVLTLVLYLFGETIPKQIARKIPNSCVRICVYPLAFFFVLLYPVSLLFRGVTFLAKRAFRSAKDPELTEEDFNSVIEINEKHGLIEENESDIIQASFSFSDTSVKEVLTPKKDIYSLDVKGISTRKLAEEVCASKYSRIPLYYGEEDNIIGILIVKNFLAAYLTNPNLSLKDFIQKPYIVSPQIRIDDLVDGFRNKHTQIALVYHGSSLVGMVTMEDVLEELVGPIGEKAGFHEKTVRR
jgi:putative hemolysin